MARDYLEEQGYDLQSYVNELLRNMKDDLFDTVGIKYEDIDAAMEQVLSAVCQKVQKVPEPYNKYYRVVSEQEIEEYGLEECSDVYDGYNLQFVGFAVAKEEYSDALGDNGLELVDIAMDQDGQYKLVQIVAGRIFEVAMEEVLSCVNNI